MSLPAHASRLIGLSFQQWDGPPGHSSSDTWHNIHMLSKAYLRLCDELHCPQVLDVSRCGILDAGGAAICSALQQQDTLWELHLSWNALSHGTAQALETVLR